MTDDLKEVNRRFEEVKFKKKKFGGLDEADLRKKLEEVQALYERAFRDQKIKYESLLEERDRTIEELRGRDRG